MIAGLLKSVAGWKGYALVAVAGAAILAAVLLERHWYGARQYAAGAAAERVRVERLQAAVSAAMQQEVDHADAQYRGAVLVREAAQRDLASARARIDRLLRAHGRDPANPRAGRRPDDPGPDWIGGFAACYAEYGDLATDAARWADQVNGLQGYVRAIQNGMAVK